MDFWNFPFEPYPEQVAFMERIFKGIDNMDFTVCELPTGGGKSLAMICAALTWMRLNRSKALVEQLLPPTPTAAPSWVLRQLQMKAEQEATDLIGFWDTLKIQRDNRLLQSAKRQRNDQKTGVAEAIPEKKLKVIICSRTHSQLAQLNSEFKKTSFAQDYSLITLGSRGSLCIHPDKPQLSDSVNDFCAEKQPCHFKPLSPLLYDLILSESYDIEALKSAGEETECCSYFASRQAIPESDILLIPYTSIFSAFTREQLGIDLKGSIILVDEAHNILESIRSANSVVLRHRSLRNLQKHLIIYRNQYQSQMSPAGVVKIKKIESLVRALLSLTATSGCLSISSFIEGLSTDLSWIIEILIFLRDTGIVRKVRGFAIGKESEPGAIYSFVSALEFCVNSKSIHDRVILTSETLSFIAMDAESELQSVIGEARALILIGGTMKPISEFSTITAKPDFWSGEAVFPPSNLHLQILGQNDSGENLTFSFGQRENEKHWEFVQAKIEQIGTAMNCGGLVVFVPNYDLIRRVKIGPHWKSFYDSKDYNIAELLSDFKDSCKKRVTILVSVVGGRLSEGIDLKDDLCRCLVLIGLPYPNPGDPMISAKMAYYDSLRNPEYRGSDFYESRCFKAIHQTLGRAIRHRSDWSAILLIDSRYLSAETFTRLPNWLKRCTPFGSDRFEMETFRQFQQKMRG
jgi:chromosome transmission fidelity protein 1